MISVNIPHRIKSFQPSLSLPAFVYWACAINFIIYHYPLLSFASESLNFWQLSGFLSYATLAILVLVFSTTFLFLIALISIRLLKAFCLIAVILNATALYFMLTYRVMLDETMLGNILNTDMDESTDFIHPKLFIYLLIFAGIPAFLLIRTQITKVHRIKTLAHGFITLCAGVLWIYGASSTWLWFDDHSKHLGGRILPWSYVVGLIGHYVNHSGSAAEQVLLPPAEFVGNTQKKIIILVIGETARSANFSLYGYPKETNPRLKQQGVIALNDPIACSTYTTASINCMLSHTDNNSVFSDNYEPLPSYLNRHNVDVIWRTDNWGEPPIKVNSYTRGGDLRKTCEGPDCPFDGVLLHNLYERIAASKQQNILVILHQKGSHGPAYYSRYPAQFNQFKPVCETVDLQQCSSETLVNAYDNTILYTDYFLHQAIQVLKKFTDTSTMLMYLSDHGESLGEYNLYLHGTPYAVAPDVQKDIPFLLWMSDRFIQSKQISVDKFQQQPSYSQHHVFHSIMGAFDMRSEIYQDTLDIFQQ